MRLCLKETSAWIISLDRGHDRWVRSFRALSTAFPPGRLHRISALDGRDFSTVQSDGNAGWKPEALTRLQREGHVGQQTIVDPFAIALCLSHQRALHAFLQSGEKWGIIFEDNARPENALIELLAEGGIIHPPENTDLLFLHHRVEYGKPANGQQASPLEKQSSVPSWSQIRSGKGLEAYAVNVKGARKMLAAWKPLVTEGATQLMTFINGNAAVQDKSREQNNHSKNGEKAHWKIHAYAPQRPLFQRDHWVPAVKLAVAKDLSINPESKQPQNLEFEFYNITLNTAHALGLAAVWFNPAGYQSRKDNFMRFYEGMRAFSDRLLIVELAFEKKPWQLPTLPNLVRLRSNTVCWQKEALLNYAFDQLVQAGFKHLAWLDADIVFETAEWYAKTVEVLERKNLCQVFSEAETHFPDLGKKVERGAACEWVAQGKSPLNLGCTGFGWAMRKEGWEAARLFDLDIVGGGDYTMWHGVFANYLSQKKCFGMWRARHLSEKSGLNGPADGLLQSEWK